MLARSKFNSIEKKKICKALAISSKEFTLVIMKKIVIDSKIASEQKIVIEMTLKLAD